jgi:hypothetical protein
MAVESIGTLVPTKIPGYADAADIQAALRAYHYGSYTYDTTNSDTANLINPSIAYTLNNLQSQISGVGSGYVEKTSLTAKGALISASATSTVATLAVGANGTVLGANSATATGLEWITPVTASSTTTFTNKTINGSNNTISNVAISTAVSGLGTGVATFLATPTSANLLAAVTNETGTGALVFGTSPTIGTPTITSPTVTGLTLNDSSIIFEGSSADAFETTLTVTNPTADRTITLPDVTGTMALLSQVINNTLTTTTGDMIYASANNTPARLAVGSEGTVLKVVSGTPTWSTASAGVAFAEILMLGGM